MQVKTFNGQRLYQARLRASLSQEDLAFALRAHTSAKTGARSVRRWENGEATPHSRLIPAIANVLDVTVDSLFERDDDEESSRAVRVDRIRSALATAGLHDLVADLEALAGAGH